MEYAVMTVFAALAAAGLAVLLVLPFLSGLSGRAVLTVYLNDGGPGAEQALRALHRLSGLFFKGAEVHIVDCGASSEEREIIRLLAADFGFQTAEAGDIFEKRAGD